MATSKINKPTYESNPFSLSFNHFGTFFEKNLGWAIALIVLPLIGFVFQIFLNIVGAIIDSSSSSAHAHSLNDTQTVGLAAGVVAILVVIWLLFILISIAIQVFISGVLTYVSLRNDEGKTAGFKDAIDATVKRFGRLFMAQLLASLKIFAWSLLLIIPGIIAAFRYALLPYVIMDEPETNKGVRASHDRVKALVKNRKREVFGVATVAGIIPFIGGLVQLTGNAALYRQLQLFHDNKLEKPAVHWLNYLGFILIGLFIVLIVFIVLLVVLIAQSNPQMTY